MPTISSKKEKDKVHYWPKLTGHPLYISEEAINLSALCRFWDLSEKIGLLNISADRMLLIFCHSTALSLNISVSSRTFTLHSYLYVSFRCIQDAAQLLTACTKIIWDASEHNNLMQKNEHASIDSS